MLSLTKSNGTRTCRAVASPSNVARWSIARPSVPVIHSKCWGVRGSLCRGSNARDGRLALTGFRHHRLLVARRTLPSRQSKGEAGDGDDGDDRKDDAVVEMDLDLPRRSKLVMFTCNKCGE